MYMGSFNEEEMCNANMYDLSLTYSSISMLYVLLKALPSVCMKYTAQGES